MARIARRPEGNPSERGEAGPDLEGLVSKRRDRPYQAGRSRHWVKMLWGGGRRGLWDSRRSVQRHQWSAPCLRGEPKVWSVVRVPSVAEEDDRRLHRSAR